jgi:hypothetical protein
MSEENYNIDFVLVREMAKVFGEETHDCEKMRGLMNMSTEETQNENRLALHDHLLRLQDKIGKLWLYVSGSADFEPLIRNQINREKEEADRKALEEAEKIAETVAEITLTESASSE